MRFDGKIVPNAAVTDYAQTFNNNRLTLFFVCRSQLPVDPRKGVFDYKTYDPGFFIPSIT